MRVIQPIPYLLILGSFCLPSILFAKTICVDSSSKIQNGDGSCWKRPYLHLQDALDAALQDKTIKSIWVAKGVYRPTKTYAPLNDQQKPIVGGAFSLPQNNPGITFSQQSINYLQAPTKYHEYLKTFQLIDGVSIYGGFTGHEKTLEERPKPTQQNATILEGRLESVFVWHVLSAGNDLTLKGVNTTLDRLTVRNGRAQNGPYLPKHFPLDKNQVPIYYHDDGGGLYVFARSKITLNQITFENNQAIAGGAIYVQDGSQLYVNDCDFRNNEALNGAAINARNGGPNEFANDAKRDTKVVITQSRFIDNTSQLSPVIFANDTQRSSPRNNALGVIIFLPATIR